MTTGTSIIARYQSNNPTPQLDLPGKIPEDAIKIAKVIWEIGTSPRLQSQKHSNRQFFRVDLPEKRILEIPISQQTQLLALVAYIRMATRMSKFNVCVDAKNEQYMQPTSVRQLAPSRLYQYKLCIPLNAKKN